MFNELPLHFALDDAPQGLDGVQLWSVRWHEKQFKVQVTSQSGHFHGVVAWMVVENDKHFLIGIGKALPE